jgi:hypothetical protein
MENKVQKKLDELQSGMVAGEYVYDDIGILVCRQGEILNEALISDLQNSNIENVTILEIIPDAEKKIAVELDPDQIAKDLERFDAALDRSFSPVMHYEEIQRIAVVIKKINRQRYDKLNQSQKD